MKNLSMIACVSKDNGLGQDGNLLWRFPEDQKFFRETTMGGAIIMGGKTYDSIGRALPGRENIVLSRREITDDDIKVFHDRASLDEYLATLPGKKFIIGGASLYNMYLPDAEEIYLTEVDAVKPANVFFPEFDRSLYNAEVLQNGKTGDFSYQIVRYARKAN